MGGRGRVLGWVRYSSWIFLILESIRRRGAFSFVLSIFVFGVPSIFGDMKKSESSEVRMVGFGVVEDSTVLTVPSLLCGLYVRSHPIQYSTKAPKYQVGTVSKIVRYFPIRKKNTAPSKIQHSTLPYRHF